MHSVNSHARSVILSVVCHTLCVAQSADLSPLWPPADPSTDPIKQAIRSGQISRARDLLRTLTPAHRKLWEGILAITQNDANGAIRFLRKTDHPKVLGIAYYLAKQHILFRDQMAEAIRRDAADFGPYYYLGRHYDSDVEDAEEAVRWLRLALERHERYAPARAYLGKCLERLGKIEEAEAAYNASLSVSQSQAGLARLRLAAGDARSARTHVLNAIALDPRDVPTLKLAARIYEGINQSREAARMLELAAVHAPRDASIRYQLARAYRALGEPARSAAALREFERLRAIYGINP